MRRRHAGGQVGEKRRQVGADFGIGINLAHRLHIFRAALLGHMQPVLEIVRQAGDRGGNDFAESARALAAAEHQNADGAIGLRRSIGRAPQARSLPGEADCR